ncbi:MAG: hypothetical protein QMC09_07305 [Thauera sp.]|nr:hypothetical protein [Pseudomonas sp.]
MSAAYEPVRKLSAEDSVEVFECGHPALDQFLQRSALVNQEASRVQTYVFCRDGDVVGFYSLAVRSAALIRRVLGCAS